MAATDKHGADLMELTAVLAAASAMCGIGLLIFSH
jgi:hypothetical protein